MNDVQFAFVDEYGNYGFDFEKNDVSTHFIIVAILVKGSNKEILEEKVEYIRQKYFQAGEMKSSKIRNNHKRRSLILNELKGLPFHIFAYVIDKRKINENAGIRFKKSFFKFLNRQLYDDLFKTFDQLELVADEYGNKEFMEEFKAYVKRKSIPDLFNFSSFGFNNSKSNILIQLADLLAGTIAKGYDKNQLSDEYQTFYKILEKHIIRLEYWPKDYRNFLVDTSKSENKTPYDEVILKQAVNLAYQYIDKSSNIEDIDEKDRVDFLKFLLLKTYQNPNEYIYTHEILDNLNAIRNQKINIHYFRSNIVSKLRDNGLLIASSNKGYKLPTCIEDLYDFVNLTSLNIHPMIQRITKCRDQILLATNNEIDILDKAEYEDIKRIVELSKGLV
ncbi:DUF3800 domain-containing protein [Alkalihalobacillus sp. LMS39]|uniref:DUF3800 domain-containing protein n=1 Tax=Cytobacillus spartinae TaxID=3299023 RepID=A0ABW6KK91_9BACI|nr:DUF3800 domain-containing protein [Alkalihalobacillus sp. LMS39]UOE94392.1 DUF3800 domain-containing protein [Alkalihalobacillus sp. LMS39]